MVRLKNTVISLVITIIAIVLFEYIFLLPIGIKFPGLIIVSIIIFSVVLPIALIASKQEKPNKIEKTILSMCGIVFVGYIVVFIAGSSIFTAEARRNLIGEVKEENFEEISPIDASQLPIVDEEYARVLADKKLGEITGLGSKVRLGDPTIQNVNGKLIYAIPLEHSGFFKWMNNKSGTPGYITVSATNPNDVKLVTDINGKELNLKYLNSSYFNSNIERYAYKYNKTQGLTDFSFELDNNENPYYVVTKYEKAIIMSSRKVVGVMTIDVQSGEIKDYSMDEVPEWVDRVVPIEVASSYIESWGQYVHGFINSMFGKKDILSTTEGIKAIYNNGQCYYYTGMTSAGADESTVGFMLTNTKNGQATFYKASGATETSGASSAEGKVQHLGYTATFPILINVQNEPTYFTTLKDKAGLVKMYSMVSVTNYTTVATGETVSETLTNYVNALMANNEINLEGTGNLLEVEGTVMRIGTLALEKSTNFYVVTKENPTQLYILPSTISKEAPLTKEGDKIKFKYVEMEATDITIKEFDNLELDIK